MDTEEAVEKLHEKILHVIMHYDYKGGPGIDYWKEMEEIAEKGLRDNDN